MTELKNYNRLVSDYFNTGRDSPEGEIGIEIEVEGRSLPQSLGSYWTVHQDGSLRGESAEYVLTKPTKRDNVLPYLKYLQKKLSDSTVNESIRTSVHVHFNMSQKTLLQVYTVLVVYFILEELITEIAGQERVGNLFCLRLKDAEYFIDALEKCARQDDYIGLTDEGRLRYTAVNVCALNKFNSLEFRAMRGTIDPGIIYNWVSLLAELIDNSVKYYRTPLEVIQDFSAIGPDRFLGKVFKDHILEFNYSDLSKRTWEGLRLVQSLAYCTTWNYSDQQLVKRVFTSKKARPRVEDMWDEPLAPVREPRVTLERPRNPAPPRWAFNPAGAVPAGNTTRVTLDDFVTLNPPRVET